MPEVTVQVRECASMPSPRASAAACACLGKGYVFAGRNATKTPQNDIWEYNPTLNKWTSISGFTGKARVKPTLCADDTALYMGLGFSGEQVYVDSCYLHDWWRYSPATGKWTRLTDCPYPNINAAVAYHVGSRIYVIYGSSKGFSRDIYWYDIPSNTWNKHEDDGHRALSGFGGCGAIGQGRCFYGTGLNTGNLKDWYEADLSSDSWQKRTSLPGKGRELSACCAAGDYIYVFGGRHFAGEYTGGEVFESMLRYDIGDDEWQYCGTMPYGRSENAIAFSIGGKAYFGLGEDEDGIVHPNLYCIE